jgi:hypothetical protein
LGSKLLLVVILFLVPITAVFVVPLVLRWAGLLPPRRSR